MFNNKIEKFSIRKTKIAVASVLTGLFLIAPAITQNNVSLFEPAIVYADESREIARDKYTITANVDTTNAVQEGTNAQNKSVTSVVNISIPDTTGITAGDYITYEVNGMNYQSNNFVMVNGVHVGVLTEVSNTDAVKLIESSDPNQYDKVRDGYSSVKNEAKWRIIFNKNIETLASATLEIRNLGSMSWVLADHEHQETISIKDSQGTVLSSKTFTIPSNGINDVTSRLAKENLRDFVVGSGVHTLSSRETYLPFAVGNVQTTRDKEKYKAGTIISFEYKANDYLTPNMSSIYSPNDTENPLKVGSVITLEDIGAPTNVIGVSRTNANGYFYGKDNILKYEVTELTENKITIKLLENFWNIGSSHFYWANTTYNLSEISNTTIDPSTGRLKTPLPEWRITVNNSDGLVNEFDYTPLMHYKGSWASIDGEGLSTPKYKVSLNIQDKNGRILKENHASTAYLIEGSQFSLNGPDTVVINGVTYYPETSKTYTGALNKNNLTVTLTYTEATPIDFDVEYRPTETLDAGQTNILNPGKQGKRVGDRIIEAPTKKIVEVGIKPVVERTPIPFTTTYEANPSLDFGTRRTKVNGINGETIAATTYDVNPQSGEVIPTMLLTTVPKTDEVIELGTKPIINSIVPGIATEQDPSIPEGTTRTIPGVPGEETTTYTVDPRTGNVTPTTSTTRQPIPTREITGTGQNIPIPFERIYETDPSAPFGTTETIPGENGLKDVTGKILKNPTTEIVKVGTQEKVEVVEIEHSTTYIANEEAEKGVRNTVKEGKNGSITITTTYEVNPQTGEVTEVENEVTIEPEEEVISVGTKPEITEEITKFETIERPNPNLPEGTRKVITPGEDGMAYTIMPFVVNKDTGEVTPGLAKGAAKPPVDEIVEVGTGKNVAIPFTTRYVADPEAEPGSKVVETPGVNGEKDVTGKIITDPVTEVVKVGTKGTSTTTPIPYTTEERENPNLPVGTRVVIQNGEDGWITASVRYTLDETTGEVTPSAMKSNVPAEPEIVEIGTGKNVAIPFTTRYVADPEAELGSKVVETPGVNGEKDVTGKIITEPVTEVVKVGTKRTVKVEKGTPFKTVYEADNNLPAGEKKTVIKGKDETITTTTEYEVNILTGEVTEVAHIETYLAVDEIIKVGTKGESTRTLIPYTTEERENPNLPVGTRNVIQKGEDGWAISSVSYTLDEATGEVIPSAMKSTVPAEPEIVEVGTGENVVIPFTTRYVADPSAEPGSKVVEIPGVNGEADVTGKIITEPVTEVVKVGTMSTGISGSRPFQTEERENPNLPIGTRVVIQKGEIGWFGGTSVYTLNEETGEVTEILTRNDKEPVTEIIEIGTGENIQIPFVTVYEEDPELPVGEKEVKTPGVNGEKDVTGKVITEPIPEIVKVGTKTKTEVITKGNVTEEDPELPEGETKEIPGKDGEKITTYTVDPNTGEITETVTVTPPVDTITKIGTKETLEDFLIHIHIDGKPVNSFEHKGIKYEEFISHMSKIIEEYLAKGFTHKASDFDGNSVTLRFNSPAEYNEEWVETSYTNGTKDKDADKIVSIDKVIPEPKKDDNSDKVKEEKPNKDTSTKSEEKPKGTSNTEITKETTKTEVKKEEEVKKLPNTGTKESSSYLALGTLSSIFGLLGLVSKKKKGDN